MDFWRIGMSKFISFLKKAGMVVVDAATTAEFGFPIFGKLIPKAAQPVVQSVVSDLEQFAGAVTTVEAVAQALPTGLTGEQKFAAVLPAIGKALGESSIMLGKKVADSALYNKAMSGYAQATVDLLNSLSPDTISVQPLTKA